MFKTICTRHYSLNELELRLAASINNAADGLSGPESDLWTMEAAALCDADTYLEHVRFTAITTMFNLPRLRMLYVVGPKAGTADVYSFRP